MVRRESRKEIAENFDFAGRGEGNAVGAQPFFLRGSAAKPATLRQSAGFYKKPEPAMQCYVL